MGLASMRHHCKVPSFDLSLSPQSTKGNWWPNLFTFMPPNLLDTNEAGAAKLWGVRLDHQWSFQHCGDNERSKRVNWLLEGKL